MFIQDGHFARHIRRMRTLYRARRDALVEAIRRELDDILQVRVPETGMYLVGWLPQGMNDIQVMQQVVDRGLEVYPLSRLFLEPQERRGGLLLGYAAFNEEEIRSGVRQLANVLRSLRALGKSTSSRCDKREVANREEFIDGKMDL